MQTKLCPKCGQYLPFDQFHSHIGKKHNLKSWCKSCDNTKMAERRKTDPAWAKDRNERKNKKRREDPNYIATRKNSDYLRLYGITLSEAEEIKVKQNGKCAVCFVDLIGGTQTHVDHNHDTGKVRGILCTNCNRGLGHFQDSKKHLASAIEYLERHS